MSAVTLRELMCLGSLVRPADGTSSWVRLGGVKSWHAAGFVRCVASVEVWLGVPAFLDYLGGTTISVLLCWPGRNPR